MEDNAALPGDFEFVVCCLGVEEAFDVAADTGLCGVVEDDIVPGGVLDGFPQSSAFVPGSCIERPDLAAEFLLPEATCGEEFVDDSLFLRGG